MTRHEPDRELLEATWRLYTEEFADHVGEVVTPYDHVDTEDHVRWGAQVFMFGYALGSVAGARAAVPDPVDRETDTERVQEIVDTVVDIAAADDVPVDGAAVERDLLGDGA